MPDPRAAADLLQDWHPPLTITAGCVLTCAIYLRDFFALRRTQPHFETWRAWSFTAGLAVLWIALTSPLEVLADTVLTAHMVEHLLLMMAVPPLIWLGWPVVPLLRGLPAAVRRWTVAPMLRSAGLRAATHGLCSLPGAWLLMNASLLLWHIPAAYDFALMHEAWHDFEHLCFLVSALLFWRTVVRPWPFKRRHITWALPVSLALADVVNTVLAALLAFSGRPVYRFYVDHSNSLGMNPLTDQQVGSSLMWVFGSLGFLAALVVTVRNLLKRDD